MIVFFFHIVQEMGHSSEEETEINDFGLENYSEKCYQQLRDGNFEVKISEEVYRCPYCCTRKGSNNMGSRIFFNMLLLLGRDPDL